MVVGDIDVRGDGEVVVDTVAIRDGIDSMLTVGIDRGESLADEDIEILEVGNGLFEEEIEDIAVVLSDTNAVAVTEGGKVGAPVAIAVSEEKGVRELKLVIETALDNEGSVDGESVDSNDSVKSGVNEGNSVVDVLMV
jgi:hypothetical protein